MLDELPDNSHKARRADKVAQQQGDDPKKDEPTPLKGKLIRRKKSRLGRIGEIFTGEDIKDVVRSVFEDMIVPTFMNTLADAIDQSTRRILLRDDSGGSRNRTQGYRPNSPYTSRTDYRSYSSSRRDAQTRPPAGRRPRAEDTLDWRELVFADREDADNVIYQMEDKINRFRSASISELYQIMGADDDEIDYTDETRGWFSARGFHVRRDGDLFRLVFPRPEYLDRD